MGVKISALPTATQAEAASGLIPVVTDPNGDGNLITKHITASSIGGGGANVNTSSSPPSNPSNGDLWFDEGNAELYIYNSSINGWIQTNGGGGSGGESTSAGPAVRAMLRVRPPNGNGGGPTLVGSGYNYPIENCFNIAQIRNPQGTNQMQVTFTNPIMDPFIVMPVHQTASYQSAGGLTNNGPISGVTSTEIESNEKYSVFFTYNNSGEASGLTLSGNALNISTNISTHGVYGLLVF